METAVDCHQSQPSTQFHCQRRSIKKSSNIAHSLNPHSMSVLEVHFTFKCGGGHGGLWAILDPEALPCLSSGSVKGCGGTGRYHLFQPPFPEAVAASGRQEWDWRKGDGEAPTSPGCTPSLTTRPLRGSHSPSFPTKGKG